MITQAQAKIGARVKWQGLDNAPAAFGTIVKIKDGGRLAEIEYDDGEEGNTYIDSAASCVYFVAEG